MKSSWSILNEENVLLTGIFNVILEMKMVMIMLILLNNHICYQNRSSYSRVKRFYLLILSS